MATEGPDPIVAARPRLRTDLVVQRQRWRGRAVVVIKDPAAGRFFRLDEAGYAIARRLRGEQTVEELATDLREREGLPVDAARLGTFARELAALGFLAAAATAGGRRSRRPWHQRLLAPRVTLLAPGRALARVAPLLPLVLNRATLAAGILLLALALALVVERRAALGAQLATLAQPRLFPLFYLAVALLLPLHELGHALMCARFGGRVPRIGIGLYLCWPVCFCDTSDSWLFPRKSQRLGVTAAGPLAEVAVGIAAAFAWVAMPHGTLGSTFLLIVMLLAAQDLAFNLNPLLRLDGYWLLSDALEVPNLRPRAFAHLWRRLRAWCGRGVPPRAERRLARIYWWYGVPALLYTVAATVGAVWFLGHWLPARFGGVGIALYALTLITLAQGPALWLHRRWRAWRTDGEVRCERAG